MQQWVPGVGNPFQQWQKVPASGLDVLTFLQMRAQVRSFDPDLERTPRTLEILIDPATTIGIVHEGDLDREDIRVPG